MCTYGSVDAFVGSVPKCESVGPNSASSGDSELQLDFPPIEGCGHFGPNGTFLTPQRRRYSDTLLTRNGIYSVTFNWVINN